MPGAVERFAPAKINLALHVLGRRPDGYHEIDTLAVFADVGDRVRVRAADAVTLSVFGPFADAAPAGDDNLAMRAARLLKDETGFSGGAEIRLEKNLPAGAGFGGGSADAAAALHALNDLWGLRLSFEELSPMAGVLGADVPMCLFSRALRARGRGELLEPIGGWPALPLVLAWPGRGAATADVFAALTRRRESPLRQPPTPSESADAAEWLAGCRNDLQEAAMALVPEVASALRGLHRTEGCLLARISGSGSGCFGLYRAGSEAEAAELFLRQAEPRWWVAATLAG